MDREQIEKWAREADEYACDEVERLYPDTLQHYGAFKNIRDEHLIRLVHNAALERAAKAIRRRNEGRHPIMVSERVEAEKCANAIDALKEQP